MRRDGGLPAEVFAGIPEAAMRCCCRPGGGTADVPAPEGLLITMRRFRLLSLFPRAVVAYFRRGDFDVRSISNLPALVSKNCAY
jgi:hypothetical protein